jgi:hypothetical protein
MFSESFEHYLSFGSTDQETFRVLEGQYDGIVVPATIAVLQREGTGGFLLALSAAAARTTYVIDPRTPLFQQALPRIKRAHRDLAAVLEDERLASDAHVDPSAFDNPRCQQIAERWVRFNETYRDTSGGKFDKYAKRLGQALARPNAQGPELILAPYFVANSPTDQWAAVSQRLYEFARTAATSLSVIPVVATENESALPRLARMYDSPRVVIWVSDFNERDVEEHRLVAYGNAVRALAEAGIQSFAVYGSFFAISLMHVGLAGFNHGVGFGDSRDWRELPQSGPPLPRYYLYGAHRYVAPEFAQQLYALEPTLVECPCAICDGRPPLTLDYHALMQHSVLSRQREIAEVRGLDLPTIAAELDDYFGRYVASVGGPAYGGGLFARRALDQVQHLAKWASALRALV